MANTKIRGITIEIGGDTTKLGKALEDSEKKSSSLQNELRQINQSLKFNPDNVELLAQKQAVLTDSVAETTEKLEILREAERQVIAQFERGEVAEDQVRALTREIIKTENQLESMKKELSGTANEADDLANSFDEVEDSADDANGGFTIMKGALADLTANAIQGAISAVGDFVASLFELSEATEEYRIMQNKLAGSADTFGYSVDFANSKYKEFYGYLSDDQMATNAITNLMGLGTSTENISKLAEGAIGVWTAYGDSIPIESLTESINETAQVGKVTGTLADALNWAGISEDDFNEKLEKTTSTQERADLIAQVLNDTYGESKQKYDELSGSITDANEAELELKDTQAELGKTMEPVNTAITDLKNKALEAVLPVVKDVANAFLDMLTWAKENPGAMQVLTATIVTLATAFGILAGALAIQSIISGVTKAIALLNTTLLANPIVLIISAIAGLVAGFIYLWNNCDAFREFWIGLWEKIKTAFQSFIEWISPGIEAIKGYFVSLWEKISEVWSNIMTSLQPLFDAITGAFREGWELIKVIWDLVSPYFMAIWENIKAIFAVVKPILEAYFKNAWEGIKLIWSVVGPYFQTLWENIKLVFSTVVTFFSGMFSSAWEGIKAIWNAVTGYFTAIWNTIRGIFSVVKSVLTGDFRGAWEGIKGIVSTWTSYFSGVWSSIKKVFSSVRTWFSSTFSSAWTAVKGVFANWGSFFSGLWDKIKNTFSKIGTNIANAISASVKAGINGAISAIERTINSGIDMINGAIDIINLIPGVGIGKIGKLNLPRLYRGGVLKKGQVGLLEGDGAEAVVPLEKETGWINRIAQKMSDFQQSNPSVDNLALASKMDEMIQTMRSLKSTIVLDTGTLVGETINQIDAQLGNTYSMRERRI